MPTSGFGIALIVILVLAVLVLGIALLKPKSAVGQALKGAEFYGQDFAHVASGVETEAVRWGKVFVTDAEALAAGFKRIEPELQTELQAMLTAAEKRLTDMSAEDRAIATANEEHVQATAKAHDAIQAANDTKALKMKLLQTHVDTLQAHITAQQQPGA